MSRFERRNALLDLVADGSRLGRRASARVCDIDRIGVAVTDAAGSPVAAAIADKGIRVVTA